MRTVLASIILFFSMALAAAACPNWQFTGATFNYSSQQLQTPQQFSAAAVGGYDLSTCQTPGAFTRGFAGAAPSYTFNLAGMEQSYLVLEVVSQCDSTMLVHAANGSWLFDDDGNGNLDPRLEIRGSQLLNGRLNVWLGTYNNTACSATLQVQAFNEQPVAPTPVAACPDWNFQGARIDGSGPSMGLGSSYSLTAMGGADLFNCIGIPAGRGYAPQAPQYSFHLSGMSGYELDLSVQADCDTVMVVNSADATWYFDDDSGGSLNPALRIPGGAGLEGRLDVWVGTYGGGSCPATLTARSVSASLTPVPPAPAPTPAGGCPSFGMTGQQITSTGEILYSPQRYSVQAGGATHLSGCGIPGASFGYVDAAPDYTFFLSGMEDYGRLEIEVESSCDPLLLVSTSNGQWFFNDDSDGLNPALDISGITANGQVNVWVGTYGGETCPVTLEMETWYN